MRERQRNQLDAGGRKGVEAWQVAAPDQRQRKTLIAVTEEVASCKHIAHAKVFIDLSDYAVNPVREARGGEQIVSVRIRRNIRRGPGMTCQQVGDDRIFSSGISDRRRRERSRYIRLRRHVPQTGDAAVLALALVREVKECRIFLDGSSERT